MTFQIDESAMAARIRSWQLQGLRDCSAHCSNPLCGDDIEVHFAVSSQGFVEDAAWMGYSCSLCSLSCDYILERSMGGTAREAGGIGFDDVCASGKIGEVRRSRQRCVQIPIDACRQALEGVGEIEEGRYGDACSR